MKLKCVTNKVNSLPEELLKNYSISYKEFFLEEQKEYVVYSIQIVLNYTWFCIKDEMHTSYPNWAPSPLFEVTDKRISRFWMINNIKFNNNDLTCISFSEWVNDINFYDDLVEEDVEKAKIFRSYKEFMDLEFPDNNIKIVAEVGDETWLICPLCIDAFEYPSDKDAMVRCPKCQTIMHNPRYKNEWPHLPS